MRTTGVLIFASLLASAGMAGCADVMPPPEPGDALVATLGDAGSDVILRPDQVLDVRLYLDEGTGLVWQINQADHLAPLNRVESVMSGRFGRPLPPSVGHGGVVQTFSFRAVGRGEGQLVFTLKPSREGDVETPAKQVATYNIRVL